MYSHTDGIAVSDFYRKRTQERLATLERFRENINELRKEEGAALVLVGDNPDFDDNPDCLIEVVAPWTDFKTRRFGGKNLDEALENAVKEKKGQADA